MLKKIMGPSLLVLAAAALYLVVGLNCYQKKDTPKATGTEEKSSTGAEDRSISTSRPYYLTPTGVKCYKGVLKSCGMDLSECENKAVYSCVTNVGHFVP
jgi:hypothetical protein